MKDIINRIDFDKNDNNKLACYNFLAVLPPEFLYEPGDKFQIRINETHYCFTEVIVKKYLTFDQLINYGYNFIDAGLSELEYYQYLCNKFEKKKWWKGKDTIFNAIFFKKITQLNMFENNDIYEK